jgi:tetratricopeptide (TPR) repeat protein
MIGQALATDEVWDTASRSPREILQIFITHPIRTGLLICATLGACWLSFTPLMGGVQATATGLLFLCLWVVMGTYLPTVFRFLFLVAILSAALWGYTFIRANTPGILGAGLMTFGATVMLAFVGVAVLRAEFLVPLGVGGLAGIAAYLELGGGVGATAAGAVVMLIGFLSISTFFSSYGSFLVGFVWIGAMGLVAAHVSAALFLGPSIDHAQVLALVETAAQLWDKGGTAKDLAALLTRIWAILQPPSLLGGWIVFAAGLVGVVRHRTRQTTMEMLGENYSDPQEEARLALAQGEELLDKGQLDGALRYFDQAAQYDTDVRPAAQFFVALVLLRRGDEESGKRAASLLDSGVMSNQQRYLLGAEFERVGEWEEAQVLYERLKASDPKYNDVTERLAEVTRRMSDVSGEEIAHLVAKRVIGGRYKEIRLIARGAMGFVFKGRDIERDGELVAIKVMSPLVTEGKKEAAARFIREAELIEGVDHPNVIKILGTFPGNVPYYAMEFVRSQSLGETLKIRGRLDRDRAVNIAVQMLAGLQAAHAKNIIHRDVKPDNVLLDEQGGVRLVDFGIAKFAGATKLTQTGASVGTPLYMSPEQVKGDEVGAWSDVYAVGVVLYEMLSGTPPFSEMAHHLSKPVPALPKAAEVPAALAQVVSKALAKTPAQRYSSAQEFGAALKAYRGAKPSGNDDVEGLVKL